MLGAAVVGLILAPLPVSAGMSTASKSDQQIEYVLAAATTARTAYTTYYAAANDACTGAIGMDATLNRPTASTTKTNTAPCSQFRMPRIPPNFVPPNSETGSDDVRRLKRRGR